MSDENDAGHNWWAQQCANLKPRLTDIMDQIFRMRSLHVVTCLVADDLTNCSAEHVWWLCFKCSCSQWAKQGYCPCVAMVAHWYDLGFTDLDGMSTPLPGNKPMGRPRRWNRKPKQRQEPDIEQTGSIVVEATPADVQPGEHAPRDPPVHNPAPRYCSHGPNDGQDTSIEWTNRDKFWLNDPTYEKRYGPKGVEQDEESFKQSSNGGAITVSALKEFYSILRALHGTLPTLSLKADMVKGLANWVDMDLFWAGWLENDQREWDRFRALLHSIMLAWSQARLCDEFLQWGYDLESFVKELPDDSRRAGIVTQSAEEQIAEWMTSGDWGGWAACHHQFPDSAKGLRCLCGGVRKLARAEFVVTFLANPAMETSCDACGDRLDQGDEIEFCGRKKRLSEQEPGTFISCHVFICKTCVASCSEGDRLERVWEQVEGANGKASWPRVEPMFEPFFGETKQFILT